MGMAAGLQTHIWNNNLKSIGLLAFYPFLIAAMVWAVATVVGYAASPSAEAHIVNQHALNFVFDYFSLILMGVIIWFTIAYFFHTKMVRGLSHSHPVTREQEPELYNLLENLCIAQGMNMPKLEIIESHARNAFASGIDEKSFTVTVTRGLLQSLAKDEVEAVLAHELTHIINRDVRLLIITIIFTGMIGFAAQMMWSQIRYSLWIPRHRSGERNNGGIFIFFAILVILWLGYLATLLTRFALSRRREYMADAGAVQMTKNPEAMMRALMRISGMAQIPKIPDDINIMCIENRSLFLGMFATHPPIEKRINALSQMTNTPIPDLPKLETHIARASRDERFQSPQPIRENWTTRQRFRGRRSANPWR